MYKQCAKARARPPPAHLPSSPESHGEHVDDEGAAAAAIQSIFRGKHSRLALSSSPPPPGARPATPDPAGGGAFAGGATQPVARACTDNVFINHMLAQRSGGA